MYNVERFIERFVISLFTNTIAEKCEFIFVDDCSPDDSVKIINKLMPQFKNMKDSVIILHHDRNRGLAAARNTALLQAHGKYIICVDSDDWLEPDYLEKLYKKAEETNADIVGCDYFRESRGHSEICINPLNKNPRESLKEILSGKTLAFLWIKLFKRELFTKNNIMWTEGVDVTEDVVICSRLFSEAKAISYVNKPLYHYNLQNQTSLTASLDEKKITQIITACELLEKELASDFEYSIVIKQRKALSKMWILLCAIDLKDEYFSLWNEERLYLTKTSIKRKFILFLCNLKLFFIVKIILRYFKTSR